MNIEKTEKVKKIYQGIDSVADPVFLEMSDIDWKRFRAVSDHLGNVICLNLYCDDDEARARIAHKGIGIMKRILRRYGVEEQNLSDEYLSEIGGLRADESAEDFVYRIFSVEQTHGIPYGRVVEIVKKNINDLKELIVIKELMKRKA